MVSVSHETRPNPGERRIFGTFFGAKFGRKKQTFGKCSFRNHWHLRQQLRTFAPQPPGFGCSAMLGITTVQIEILGAKFQFWARDVHQPLRSLKTLKNKHNMDDSSSRRCQLLLRPKPTPAIREKKPIHVATINGTLENFTCPNLRPPPTRIAGQAARHPRLYAPSREFPLRAAFARKTSLVGGLRCPGYGKPMFYGL